MSKKPSKRNPRAPLNHNVGEILRALMKEKNVDDVSLSNETGVPYSSLSRIKNDAAINPTLNSLMPLADYFKITVSQLIGEVALGRSYIAEPGKSRSVVVKQVPVLDWDQIDDFREGAFDGFKNWLPCNRDLSEKAFVLMVKNSSLGKIFLKGAYIFVDPDIKVEGGDYVLVSTGSSYFIKRVMFEGTDTYLQSLNPNIDLTEKLKPEEQLFAPIVEARYAFREPEDV